MRYWTIEFSPEVRRWYEKLTPTGLAQARRILALLEERGPMLAMPHSRSLGGGLRELRFSCEDVNRRITYVVNPEHRVITLTTFRKQRPNERTEVTRARKALARLRADHAKNGKKGN